MSSEKLTKKEIREPDQFLKVTTEFWKKAAKYQKALGLVALAVVAVFVVAGFVEHSSAKKANASGAALSQALELSGRGVGNEANPTEGAQPNFSTSQEKYQAIVAALEKLRSEYPGTNASRSAAYYLGDAQYQLRKFDEADALYAEFVGLTKPGDPLRVLALEGRGYIAESKQDWAKALEMFDQMDREASGDGDKALAAYQRARILAESGKKQEAAAAFQKVLQDYQDDPIARQAGERLALLAGEGIVAPAAPKAAETKVEKK